MLIFLLNLLQFALGIFVVIILLALMHWDNFPLGTLNQSQVNSLIIVSSVYVLHQYTLYLMTKFPGNRSSILILPSLTLWYVLSMSLVIIFRLEYSISYISSSVIFSIIISFLNFIFNQRKKHDVFAYIPVGKTHDLTQIPNVNWIKVHRPKDLNIKSMKAIVADLHSPNLDAEWQKFLAEKTLQEYLYTM